MMKNLIRKRRVLLLLVLVIFCMGGVLFAQSEKNERTQLSYNEKRSVLIDPNPIINSEFKDKTLEEALKSVAKKSTAGLFNRVNHFKVEIEQVTGSVTDAGSGDTTVVEIRSEGVELSYSKTEIRAKAGEKLLIRYINESEMSHNIVLLREEKDIRPVGIAALQAVSNEWIPESEMDRILAYSELAHPGDTVEVSFKVPSPGTYPYICTYSAHWTQMQGRLISTE